MFWKRTIWRILFSVVVILLILMAGGLIYRAGFTHGALTEITIPEGSDINLMPHGYAPYSRHFGPRLGLLGFFPFFLCFAGIFLVMMVFGAGRRMMYWKYAGKNHKYWKTHGPGHWHGRHWGPGCPPWEEDQPESESENPAAESEA